MVDTITLLQIVKPSKVSENNELSETSANSDRSVSSNDFADELRNATTNLSATGGKDVPSIQPNTQSCITDVSSSFRIISTNESVSNEALLDFMTLQGLDQTQISELASLSHKQRLQEAEPDSSKWLTFFPTASNENIETALVSEIVNLDLSDIPIIEEVILKTSSKNDIVDTVIQVIKLKPLEREFLAGYLYKTISSDSGGSISSTASNSATVSKSASSSVSNSLFDSGQGDTFSEKEQSDFDQPVSRQKDFRDAVAEYLRKADTLKDLSDRLGTFMAKQLVASLARGRWSIEMQLHPKELGTIQIEMNMTERGLEAVFKTTQVATRELLMDSMPRLKQWFEEGGINLAYSGLSDSSESDDGEKSSLEQEAQDSSNNDLEKDELSEISISEEFELTDQGFDVRV